MASDEIPPTVEQLWAGATRGEDDALDQLLASYLPRLRAFIRVHMSPALRAQESCSDIVQSVCREIVERRDRYEHRDESSFRGWLFASALSKIRDRHRFFGREKRDAARAQPLEAGDPGLAAAYATMTPSRGAMAREEIERIETAFDSLPEHYREVVAMARIAELPHAEIAARIGKSVGAVRMILGRALTELATRLERPEPADDDTA